MATICAIIANRFKGKKEKEYKVEQFMPQYGSKKQDARKPEQLLEYWKSVVMPQCNRTQHA